MYKLVAATPLRTSTAITMEPHLEPRTRKVLVAPALPLPYSRISIPKKERLTQTAVGIEPIRYAERMSRISVIQSNGCSWTTNILKNHLISRALKSLFGLFSSFEADPAAL